MSNIPAEQVDMYTGPFCRNYFLDVSGWGQPKLIRIPYSRVPAFRNCVGTTLMALKIDREVVYPPTVYATKPQTDSEDEALTCALTLVVNEEDESTPEESNEGSSPPS
ncbi:hypothetical protein EJ08DRAFT_650774 [Tothia fuscella]|uniref:Uncharacterized protein n=1 Tax=Tothia fuscella TaxID=1048955 RepID=A0A9P4TXM8_9PEZI|nr:hypothetical protein EJ08DRAFT_650774 [Tothia fuscella]